MGGQITFNRLGHPYRLRQIKKVRRWLTTAIEYHGFELGEVAIIFCTDEELLQLNQEALAHDFYTDIITFDHCVGDLLSGDLYISIDRVKENAIQHKTTTYNELLRVMVHGVLHLCGFGDKSEEEARTMRAQENQWLHVFHVEPK